MIPPRHLTKVSQDKPLWSEDERNSSHLTIPSDFCVFNTTGWFTSTGALFDCHNQYPLLMKKGRKDLDLSLKDVSIDTIKKWSSHQTDGPLFSMLLPFNDAFSHSFSTGVSLCVYALYLMNQHDLQHSKTNNATIGLSRILIPSNGPFLSILETLGVPRSRIITADHKESLYYSSQATLILRRPPFNILIQAHWPAHALCDMRDKTVAWLETHGYLKNNDTTIVKHDNHGIVNNLVVYLWRTGERSVHGQDILVDKIRHSLKPGYELIIEGKQKISYSSTESQNHWRQTARLFVHAVAVIGPHGGAFGNIFLCSPNTTIIEFNVPWTAVTADGDSGSNSVRDMFYSLARGIGNVDHFWSVWPSNRYLRPEDFYHSSDMRIEGEEVVEILRREGIAV